MKEDAVISEMFIRAIEAKDNKSLLKDTMECVVHKLNNNNNCLGCVCELQCLKLTTLLLIDLTVRSGQSTLVGLPTGSMVVLELLVDILRSNSPDELDKLLPIHLRRLK
jgi:hypothetical protein